MTLKNPAAPADATAGTPSQDGSQASDPGREPDAHETPEQVAQLQPDEGTEQREQPDGEPAPDAAAQADAEPKQPRKSRYQQRVEALIEENRSLQRQVDYFRSRAEKVGPPKRLDPLAFQSDADYQRALIAETARQSQAEFARTQAQAASQQAALVEQQIWDARVADYREQVPDFDAVAYSDSVSYGSEHVIGMVRKMPEGPQVAYFLAKNQAEAQRFATLTPLETAIELGRLAQRLKGPPKKAVSSAPNPVPTVRAKSAATGFRPDSDDIDGYFAWRDKAH